MRISAPISVDCWDGRTMEASKIEIFVIRDADGNRFFKIEGSNKIEIYMIAYYPVAKKQEAMTHYRELMDRLIDAQEVEAA
jgi:hypothetical protein